MGVIENKGSSSYSTSSKLLFKLGTELKNICTRDDIMVLIKGLSPVARISATKTKKNDARTLTY